MAVTKNTGATAAVDIARDRLQAELLNGLKADRKFIDPKFFYDEKGSSLFTRICDLPEYYLTRTEASILKRHGSAIADFMGTNCVLIEPGAGSCEKVRYLLPEIALQAYIPMDISKAFLQQAAAELASQFPALKVIPVAADFSGDFEIPVLPGRRILFYPGSTIGNSMPHRALAFLARMHRVVGENGGLIIGIDLHKEPAILNAAYNDSQGITAAFNRNILHHVNHLLGANFDPEMFQHKAFYNEGEHRIEMHLISTRRQTVSCDGGQIQFEKGEGILTEYSYKYTVESFTELAAGAGFSQQQNWSDDHGLFSVLFFQARAC